MPPFIALRSHYQKQKRDYGGNMHAHFKAFSELHGMMNSHRRNSRRQFTICNPAWMFYVLLRKHNRAFDFACANSTHCNEIHDATLY
jgi:hypothetical protein